MDQTSDAGNGPRGIGIRLGDARLLVAADRVREVLSSPCATPVPGTRDWLRGLASLDGEVFPVIDLEGFLGGPGHAPPVPGAPLLLVDDGGLPLGLAVDEVTGFPEMAGPPRDGPPAVADGWLRRWVRGHCRDADAEWGILDLAEVLRDPAFRQAAA